MFLFNPLKILNDFLKFIVQVLGLKVIMILSATLLINAILIKDFQNTTIGYCIYVGFVIFVAILSFNRKPFKSKTQK